MSTHVIRTSIKRALMASSYAMFATVVKTYEKRYRRFHSKEDLKRQF